MRKFYLLPYFLGVLAFLFVLEGFGQANLPVSTTTMSEGSLPTGFTHSGLGPDYTNPAKLKFDNQEDYLVLSFNSPPGELSFDVGVNNSFTIPIPATATFSVLESVNGVTYTPVASYSNVPTGTKTITTFNPNSRYIKWEYTLKPSGSNIALYKINLDVNCDPFTLPFFEGFEGGVVPPPCWFSDEYGDGADPTKDWKIENTVTHSGSNHAATVDFEFAPDAGITSDWLVSPLIELSAIEDNFLKFYGRVRFPGQQHTKYYIKISTLSQDAPEDFLNIKSYVDADFNNTGYLEKIIDLSTYSGDQVYIAFVMEGPGTSSGGGNQWYIDDIEIGPAPIEAEPTCGFENFNNSNIDNSPTYGDGDFVGNNGVEWTYVQARDENGDANNSGIDGKAIMLEKKDGGSRIISSLVPGGISDFSVKLYKGATNGGSRQARLYVNGVSQGISASFDDNDEHIFTVTGINISGDVKIEIKNNKSNPLIIDDISWSCYSDEVWDCPDLEANIGDACDDGDVTTENDVINADCECVGTPIPVSDICGFENFDNSNLAGPPYSDDSFVGNNGVTWTFVKARDENGDENNSGIDGNAIMLRNVEEFSKITSSSVPGGIADFSVKLYKGFTGGGDRQVELFVNGVSHGASDAFDDLNEHVFTVPAINISGDVIIEIKNITSKQVILDDITWTCYDSPICTSSLLACTSTFPNTASFGTWVRINGTGFNNLDTIYVGGIGVAEIDIIDDTLLYFKIPEGLSNGVHTIKLIDLVQCELFFQSVTIDTNNENCGTIGMGVFISEIFDPVSGNEHYVELYNPLSTNVDLNATDNDYALRLDLDTDLPSTYDITSTINSGTTLTLKLGANGSLPGEYTGLNGFNAGHDVIELLKNGQIIDRVVLSNTTGFKFIRKPNISGPNSTYITSEWIIDTGSPDNSTIGSHDYDAPAPWVIDNHPFDDSKQPCEGIIFETDVSIGTGYTYTWYQNTGNSDDWIPVSSLGPDYIDYGSGVLLISPLFDKEYSQYYCVVSDGICEQTSHTARITIDDNSRRYFQSTESGSWTSDAIWEFGTSDTGPWTSSCLYPEKKNADKINIAAFTTVTVDMDLTVPVVEIEVDGILQTQPEESLTFVDTSPGPELIVNGTWIDNNNSGSSTVFISEATWILGSQGTIIKTSGSSTTIYREQYEGGILSIPADGNWIYRFTGAQDLNFINSTGSTTMHYPNLILENTQGGIYSSSGFTMTGNKSLTIKGNLEIGGDGIGSIRFSNINIHAAPVLVEGALKVHAGSELLNSIGSSTTYGTGFEVQGDMDIEGTLDLTSGGGAIEGILKLSGAPDFIGVGSGIVKLNHLIIDKDPISEMGSALDFDIYKSATFTQGILELEDYAAVTFNPGATVTPHPSNTSFVDGKVIKKRSANEEFIFPIGDVKDETNKWYQPARIFGTSGAATIEAQYFAEANANAGLYYDGDSNSPGDHQEIGNCDYWTINKTAGADVKLALKFTNDDDDVDDAYCNKIEAPDYVRIYSFNDSPEVMSWDEVSSGNIPPSEEIISAPFIGETTGGTYGYFAFGTTDQSEFNVLPIELISFTAKPENKKVQNQWSTHSETNNAFFTVERSADAKVFHIVGQVNGAGNSHTTQHYALTDPKPLPNVSYYRLKQTDFDGQSTYSDIKAVSFAETEAFSLDLTYRDENELNLVYKSISPYILVEIFDVLGKRVFTEVAENYGGHSILNPNLGRGAYVVRISAGDKSDTGKIVW